MKSPSLIPLFSVTPHVGLYLSPHGVRRYFTIARSHSNEYLGIWKKTKTSELVTDWPHHTNSSKNANGSEQSRNHSRWQPKGTTWPLFPGLHPQRPRPKILEGHGLVTTPR